MGRNLQQGEVVLRQGTYAYDGKIAGDLRIVRTGIRYGTGDHADSAEFREDQIGIWFDVHYTPAGERGVFSNGTPGFRTLDEAIESVEQRFTDVTWK